MQNGTIHNGYDSQEEHVFFEKTTKRQMFLMIRQFSEFLSEGSETWIEKAKYERDLLTLQGVK